MRALVLFTSKETNFQLNAHDPKQREINKYPFEFYATNETEIELLLVHTHTLTRTGHTIVRDDFNCLSLWNQNERNKREREKTFKSTIIYQLKSRK